MTKENPGTARALAREQHVRLTRVQIQGFKSIVSEDIAFAPVNVLIGPNGAGKSNLIAFFRMLAFMVSGEEGLQRYIAQAGGGSALLSGGPKATQRIWASLTLETDQGTNEYEFALAYAGGDKLYFDLERCRFSAKKRGPNPNWIDLGVGQTAPNLLRTPDTGALKTQKTILSLLRSMQVYQFHDTSAEATVKQRGFEDDNRYLRGDAGNLAAYLLRLRDFYNPYYRRIVDALKQFAPFFSDFVLEAEGGKILLRWQEVSGDTVFGPYQMSDGTIRAVALLTLLLQPPNLLPKMIVIDEPELGLHPYAVRAVAALLRAAAAERQCLIATQSPEFLDEFDVAEIVVVDRDAAASRLRRLPPDEFERWLREYALSELWEMNLLGGRPNPVDALS